MKLPDPSILEWVENVVGPARPLAHVVHPHAYSHLWRLETPQGRIWLKMHAQRHKWAGEVHALTRWKAPLAPELLACREDPCAVLLAEMPGADAEGIAFTPEAESRLWSEAGAWLRDFHARTNPWFGEVLPDGARGKRTTGDPTLLVREGYENRLRQGIDRDLLSPEEAAFARRAFDAGLPSLEGASAHSIHRDFHPRNWLALPTGELTAVLDFEHSRWDVLAADLNRPWDKEFTRNPRLVAAFYEAYGHPEPRLQAQIALMRLYNAVTGLVWAVEYGETPFADHNRVALRRIVASDR